MQSLEKTVRFCMAGKHDAMRDDWISVNARYNPVTCEWEEDATSDKTVWCCPHHKLTPKP